MSTVTLKNKSESAVKKAKEAAKKGVKKVQDNPITAIKIVGVSLGVFLAYRLISSATNKIDTVFDGSVLDDIVNGPVLDDIVNGTGGTTNNATISNQQAINYAQQLLDAMNVKQPLYGTDEETIEKVFDKLQTADDFIKVYNAFGTKDYNGHNSPPSGVWAYLDSYEKRNLVYWLKSELSQSDGSVYTKVKERIEGAGFTF